MKSISFLFFLLFFKVINANKEIVELLQNELKHHKITIPEIDEELFKERKVVGDMILDKINLDAEDLENYLKKNYSEKLGKFNFLDAIRHMDSISIHNYLYIYSNWNIKLIEYIAIAKKNSDNKFFDLFIVYTEVSLPITLKSKIEETGSTCLNLFGYEFCKMIVKDKIITPYDFKDVLKFDKGMKYFSFLKFKEIIENYIPQIYLHTETEFELVNLLREYQHFNTDINHIRFLSDTLSNYENLHKCFVYLYNSVFSQIKHSFVDTIKKYENTLLKGEYFKKLEKSTKLQMIKGIKEEDVKTYLDGLKRRINLPVSKHDDFDHVIESLQWSDNLLWYCIDILYSVQDQGQVKYAAILTNKDENSKYTFLISDVQASFSFYDNLIIITKSSTETGLIFNSKIELLEVSSEFELDAQNMNFILKNLAFKSYAKHFNLNVELS